MDQSSTSLEAAQHQHEINLCEQQIMGNLVHLGFLGDCSLVMNLASSNCPFPERCGNNEESPDNLHTADVEWSADRRKKCVDSMQAAAVCYHSQCEECSFWKELKEDIEESIVSGDITRRSVYRQVIDAVVEHALSCDENLRCSVPWCFFFHQRDDDSPPEEQVAALIRFYRAHDFDELPTVGNDDDQVNYIQFNNSVKWPSIEFNYGPVPGTKFDFDIIDFKLGRYGTFLTTAFTFTIPPEYVQIRQFNSIDDEIAEPWQTLSRLRQCNNIVQHHWLYYSANVITLCVNDNPATGCLADLHPLVFETREQVYNLVSGLVSATNFLHENRILYLFWSASSITLSGDKSTARLADFSYAIQHNENDNDGGESAIRMSLCLPPHLVPPEMFEEDIGTYSDIWGIGCLIYELTCGRHLHYDLHFQPWDAMRTEIRHRSIEYLRTNFIIPRNSVIFTTKENRISCHPRDLNRLREEVLNF